MTQISYPKQLDLKSRADAFVGDSERDGMTVTVPLCYSCKHRQTVRTCLAYPSGIPVEIVIGDVDHTKPYLGDHNITYVHV